MIIKNLFIEQDGVKITLEERLEKLCIDEIKINNGVFTVIGYRYTTGASGHTISEALDNFEKEREKVSKN